MRITISRTYLFLFLSIPPALLAQTNAAFNPEVYSRERSASAVGYLKTSFVIPEGYSTRTMKQDGLIYSRSYGVGRIGDVVFGSNHQLFFSLEGSSRFGLAMGTVPDTSFLARGGSANRQLYLGMVELFNLEFSPEYTFIFANGYAITLRCNVGLLNVGATFGMLEKGRFDENGLAIANIVPLSISPALLFDLGRSGFGVRAYFNQSSLVAYRYVNAPVYPKHEEGLTTTDSTFRRFWIQAVFTY